MRRRGELKPCPFCGGRAIMLIESKVLARCVWIECSECKTTSPMLEYGAAWEDNRALDVKLRQARSKVSTFWNTRADVGSSEGVSGAAG